MPPRSAFFSTGLAVALAVLALDQSSKGWLIHGFRLGDGPPVEILPFLDIVLAWNPGISYSFFSAQGETGRLVLLGLVLAATLFLLAWLWRAADKATALALGLIVGGAVGNGCDRFIYGAVADFLHVRLGGFSPWGVFNLADVAIVAGVMLLLYTSLFPQQNAAA